jgi:hypothetical protein
MINNFERPENLFTLGYIMATGAFGTGEGKASPIRFPFGPYEASFYAPGCDLSVGALIHHDLVFEIDFGDSVVRVCRRAGAKQECLWLDPPSNTELVAMSLIVADFG